MFKLFLKYWLPVLLYAILIFHLSSVPGQDLPQNFFISDYVLHMIEYLPFGFLVYRAIKNTKNIFSTQKVVLFSLVFVLLYSVSDEAHQLLVQGRSASLIDLISDNFGAIIGIKFAT